MQSSHPIPVEVNRRSFEPASRFFGRGSAYVDDKKESDLLKTIRSTLQGSRGSSDSTIASIISPSYQSNVEEEELCWDTFSVVYSAGGVVLKRWNFESEGQPVQWACIGWFEQPSSSPSSARSGNYTIDADDDLDAALPDPNQRPTFGPFTRQSRESSKRAEEHGSRARAVFVLLRSIGRVLFLNGLEYSFHIPFVVRRAWALYPHGLMLQRPLDPSEVEEAAASGEELLPTLFTMINPFAEASVVGLTTSIKDGLPVALHDTEKTASSVAAQEEVLWVSCRGPDPSDQLLATVDKGSKTMTIWRYTFVHATSYAPPITPLVSRNVTKHRQSLSGPMSPRRASVNPPMQPHDIAEASPLVALPGLPPALNTAMRMAAIVPGAVPDTPWVGTNAPKAPRTSLAAASRQELLVNLDKPPLISRGDAITQVDPVEQARMRPSFWVEKLYSTDLSTEDCAAWQGTTFGVFDRRWDGEVEKSHLGICLPSGKLIILPLVRKKDQTLAAESVSLKDAISVAAIRALRSKIDDLLLVKPDGSLSILTYGMLEVPLKVSENVRVVSLKDPANSSVTLRFQDKSTTRITLNYWPSNFVVEQCLLVLALVLPTDQFFVLHRMFLSKWAIRKFTQGEESFELLQIVVSEFLGLSRASNLAATPANNHWESLGTSSTARRFCNDPALIKLSMPHGGPAPNPPTYDRPRHKYHSSILIGLHHLAQCFLLSTASHYALPILVPLVCQLALVVRPEWADYWKRLLPDALGPWKSPKATVLFNLDQTLSVWPPDIFSMLVGKISNSDWNAPMSDSWSLIRPEGTRPSFVFGKQDPLIRFHQINAIYQVLSDGKVDTRKRVEMALKMLTRAGDLGYELLYRLPAGLAMPLLEAMRSCQMSPSSEWPPNAYRFIGRNDLAEGASRISDIMFSHGYRSVKDYILPTFPRKCISAHHEGVRKAMLGELAAVKGVELGLEDFTSTRFGQDKRLEEVSRMLCSSTVPVIRTLERPELNEHDQAKEHQHYAMRVAERTLALPPGRALFTFGSVQVVTKEAYAVPKIEYSIRISPQNIVIVPEPGKIPADSCAWGDFHNGVAAGLRISPTAVGVESSWIAFNKPSELTPEHAGFLYALGLTGHLREMLTWHTFAYLTPKHDLTSISILLGLSAANVGTGNKHVTKLIAVHTPALLPTTGVDLNVPLITQAAGLSGLGLLYMGTRNRRMAEVCLSQISRRDLVQPDLSNEYREAYTYCAALAFGMIMLGRGSDVPADLVILSRLRVLIHGEAHALATKNIRPSFDINLTSPAASIALGLMYLRTNKQDVADILTIPDTVLALDRIQPNFLMIRSMSRALIMWDNIEPTIEWLYSQVPDAIRTAMDGRLKAQPVHESFELAYYNVLAGSCFAIALKYAGTAREEAYTLIMRLYDQFTQLAYTNTPAFDQRIKRAAVRDGLNLISISLNMVMAGVGGIESLRKLRYAFGMYNPPMRYGTHVAIHMSIGLLFLGGGRYTLGTSDAAIATMVAAFFPRFSQVSSDNKSYLQALRHLWVLAVEPRCLVPRDVDTNEAVFLPVKIKVKDGKETGSTQLLAPSLIPDVDKILSIRVDTPRYWPFYIDIANIPHLKATLLKTQTLFVKRRSAFLSYKEDTKGSRSLFVRSGSSAGDAAVLDYPQLKNTDQHPATDLHHFISSYSNDPFFLAFADRFCRDNGETDDEKLLQAYCYATLHDSILQDKPRTIQAHLSLYRYRRMPLHSQQLVLSHQDLKFAHEFYARIYERRLSGRSENNPRPPLLRESTLRSALHELEGRMEVVYSQPAFQPILKRYARGAEVLAYESGSLQWEMSRALSWYLQRNGVPTASVLLVLGDLARGARTRCLEMPPPQGTVDSPALHEGIKEVVQKAGSSLTSSVGAGWSLKCVEEIMSVWDAPEGT